MPHHLKVPTRTMQLLLTPPATIRSFLVSQAQLVYLLLCMKPYGTLGLFVLRPQQYILQLVGQLLPQLEWLWCRNFAFHFIVIDYTFDYAFRSITISLALLAGRHINVSFALSQPLGVFRGYTDGFAGSTIQHSINQMKCDVPICVCLSSSLYRVSWTRF